MDAVNPDPIIVTPLRRIEHPKGDLYHAVRLSDAGFTGFGEAYFTTVVHGETKGWKLHTALQMNLIVPVGEVTFHIHAEQTGRTESYVLGANRYSRLTVPPGYWVAFRGDNAGLNLVLNVASLEHDPNEARNAPLNAYPTETNA